MCDARHPLSDGEETVVFMVVYVAERSCEYDTYFYSASDEGGVAVIDVFSGAIEFAVTAGALEKGYADSMAMVCVNGGYVLMFVVNDVRWSSRCAREITLVNFGKL